MFKCGYNFFGKLFNFLVSQNYGGMTANNNKNKETPGINWRENLTRRKLSYRTDAKNRKK